MQKLINAPYIDQSVKYPTGCESVSTVMLLQFLGYEIAVDEFIEKYLDKTAFWREKGVLYGANPNESFCGSPYDDSSFGCYSPVIAAALGKIIGQDYEVIDESGKDIEELIHEYIDKDVPVIMWACINMREPIIGPKWRLKSGEEFTWISNEHCMLLVGYDDENYYFNDPYENNGTIGYKKETVKDRYLAQHSQAVAVKKK